MLSLILAVAIAGAPPSPEESPLDEVCGYALDRSATVSDWRLMREIFFGSMEVKLREKGLPKDEADIVRKLCDVYLRGSVRESEILLKMLDKEEAKARSNPR